MSDLQKNDYESTDFSKSSVPRKKKKKSKISNVVVIVIVVVAMGVFGFSMYQLISRWVNSSSTKQDYAQAEDNYTETKPVADTDTTKEAVTDAAGDTYVRLVEPSYTSIDWDGLSARSNSHVIGWVEVPTCGISYPITQYTDNDYYLTHAYNDEFSYSGSIFLDYRLGSDWKNYHEIIYGHHMSDGAMFGSLLEYDSEDFYTRNEGKNFFFIYTPEAIRVYQIFSIGDVNIDDNPTAYKIDITSDFTIADYAEFVQSCDLYDTGITVTDEQVVTLFTCQSTSASNVRHMVHGKLVELLPYSSEE